MIGFQTKVNIIDNSGGLEGRCIKILSPKETKSGEKRPMVGVGDVVLVSITKANNDLTNISAQRGQKTNKNIIKKGDLYRGIIVRTKKEKKLRRSFTNSMDKVKSQIEYKDNKGLDFYSKILLKSNNLDSLSITNNISMSYNNNNNNLSLLNSFSSFTHKWKTNLNDDIYNFIYNNRNKQISNSKIIGNSKNKNLLNFDFNLFTESFDDNAIVLIKSNNKGYSNDIDLLPIGTRIKGPISKKLKYKKNCAKIVSITTTN